MLRAEQALCWACMVNAHIVHQPLQQQKTRYGIGTVECKCHTQMSPIKHERYTYASHLWNCRKMVANFLWKNFCAGNILWGFLKLFSKIWRVISGVHTTIRMTLLPKKPNFENYLQIPYRKWVKFCKDKFLA